MRTAFLAIAVLLTLTATSASAQGFISPHIGVAFNEPAPGCESITGCEDKRRTLGVSVGSLGRILGFELDLGYTKAFFGEASPTQSSGLLTLMGNALIAPKFGPVQPYVLAGLGVLKTNVDFVPSQLLDNSESKVAWSLGGGVMVFFHNSIGVRGDLRYFHAFQEFQFPGLSIEGTNLDLGRASAAVVFRF
jgi:opacity protein-like surface antigen